MNKTEERWMDVDTLRARLTFLEGERCAIFRELAASETPRFRRAMLLGRRAQVQQDRDETARALKNLGDPVDEG